MTTSNLQRQVAVFVSDEEICEALQHQLEGHFPNLKIIACCHTRQEAMKVAFESPTPPPRIFFVDDEILFQIPNFLSRLDSIGSGSNGILILDNPDFDKLRKAIRFGVQDCLLHPFKLEETKDVLERIESRIYHRDRAMPREAVEARRYMFWRNDVRKMTTTHMPMTQVNREYGTHFAEGLFRALFIEMSCKDDAMRVVDNRKLQDCIVDRIGQVLAADCFDILYNRHSNGVSALLNYSVTKRSVATNLIDQLFFDLKKQFWQEEKIDITMAIGRVYPDFAALPEAKQEILDARWARKQLGVGRIINAEELQEQLTGVNISRQIRNDQEMILHYMELLDVSRATHYIRQFYDTYKSVLSNRQLRQFFRETIEFMFRSYSEELKEYGDPEVLRHGYINRESTAQSMDKYIQVILENCKDVMGKVETVVRRQYSQPIRDCLAYISAHHSRDIGLKELAELVHLTPQYLSNRFHKETGQTISAYMKEQKMQLAKNMLKHSEKNVAEIADYLGFQDARYFSKFFKANQHVTPTEYRRIKQASQKNKV